MCPADGGCSAERPLTVCPCISVAWGRARVSIPQNQPKASAPTSDTERSAPPLQPLILPPPWEGDRRRGGAPVTWPWRHNDPTSLPSLALGCPSTSGWLPPGPLLLQPQAGAVVHSWPRCARTGPGGFPNAKALADATADAGSRFGQACVALRLAHLETKTAFGAGRRRSLISASVKGCGVGGHWPCPSCHPGGQCGLELGVGVHCGVRTTVLASGLKAQGYQLVSSSQLNRRLFSIKPMRK